MEIMNFQRIRINPLERMTRPDDARDGKPVRWIGQNPPPLPDGQKWVPIEYRPEAGENQRIEREFTTTKDGWRLVDLTPEEIAARNRPEPVSKLTIKRRLEALGKWDGFKAILGQAPATVQDEWALAQDIRPDDPFFAANKETFKSGLGLTEEQLSQLLTP